MEPLRFVRLPGRVISMLDAYGVSFNILPGLVNPQVCMFSPVKSDAGCVTSASDQWQRPVITTSRPTPANGESGFGLLARLEVPNNVSASVIPWKCKSKGVLCLSQVKFF